MKKTALVVLGTVIGMCQFGCGFEMAHDVLVHVLAIGWTADMLNVIP